MPNFLQNPAEPGPKVSQAVEDVAARLWGAMRRALDEAVPAPQSMTSLREQLGLDKTLASRVGRAARSPDAMEAMSLGPGAPGYRLLVERLRHRSPSSANVAALSVAIDDLERAYTFFPDGKRGFDAAMSGWVPQCRQRGERRARQQIYQATLFLMGVEVDVAYQAYVYWPSAQREGMADLGFVEVRQDVQRASNGGRAILTGVPYIIPGAGGLIGDERVETLSGQCPTDDAQIALLPEFCTSPMPALQTHARAGALQLITAGDTPQIGQRLTSTVAVIGRNIERQRRRGSDREHSQNSIALRKPVRLLVVDVLICDPLEFAAPRVTVSAVGAGPPPRWPDDDDLGTLNQSLEFVSLGRHSSADISPLASPEVANVPQLLTRLISAAKAPIQTFRAYRLCIEYPIPHARHVVWVELPAPEDHAPNPAGPTTQ
ncbi:MAG: hypothetical protein K2X32_12475 [Phycisphaerales bacterium]|nr:hypothetical protein [Phycisphaerales bacterium]